MLLGQISSVINGRVHKLGGGLYIRFKSDENLVVGNILKINYHGSEYSFEVFEIETYNSELIVQAKENGYWGQSLRNDKNIDLRNLVGIDVLLVTDKTEIERIAKESNWC